MSRIAVVTALVALTVALPIARADAQSSASFHPPPGVAPPWANQIPTTEAAPASDPTATTASLPAAQSPGGDAPGSTTTPAPTGTSASAGAPPGTDAATPISATPLQGSTTPIHVVSLRAGPGTNSPVIGTLHPGDPLEILATANYGWTEVRSPAGTGWAYGSYLASGASAPVPGSASPAGDLPALDPR